MLKLDRNAGAVERVAILKELGERITRKRAIRLKCLDCCCDSAHEVKLCPSIH